MLRQMTMNDVSQVVEIHLSSFPGFFLSFLGHNFLELYYEGVCLSPEGLSYVYLNKDEIPVGFVAGSSNPRGFYSRLLKRQWLKFALASFKPICSNPTIITRVLRGLRHPGKNPIGSDVAGLFSIGVLPETQGSGAGKKLVEKFLKEAKNKNCTKVFLTTDQENNETVNNFYKKLGFSIKRQYETPEGRKMNEYWITL